MPIAFNQSGSSFLYETFEERHEVEHVIVDGGAVHIDGDANHLIHIQKDIAANQSYIQVSDASGTDVFNVKGDGTATFKNVVLDTITSPEIEEMKSQINDRVETAAAVELIQDNLTGVFDMINETNNEVLEKIDNDDLTAAISTLRTDLESADTLIRNDFEGADTVLGGRITTLETSVTEASHQHETSGVSNVGNLVERQDDMDFKNVECELLEVDTIEVWDEIQIMGDAQLLWIPLHDVNGVSTQEVDATFRFGRSEQIGVNPAPDDGLFMKRKVANKSHVTLLQVHPSVPNLHITSDKDANTPYIQCSTTAGDPRFSVTDNGTIVSKGQHEHDFANLPDAFFGSSVHDSHSIFVGNAKISFHNDRLRTYLLKPDTVPLVLQSAPYNFTTALIPAGTNLRIHNWMQRARQAFSPVNHDLKTKDVFPQANLSVDFDEQLLRVGTNDTQYKHFEVASNGDMEANNIGCDDLFVDDRIDAKRLWMQSDTTSDQLMFVLKNQAGQRVFAIDNLGYIRNSPQEDLVVEDSSIYIGSVRLSFARNATEARLKILKDQIPTYLAGRGYTASNLPSGETTATMSVRKWMLSAKETYEDTLRVKDVFPASNTNADWELTSWNGLEPRVAALESAGGGVSNPITLESTSASTDCKIELKNTAQNGKCELVVSNLTHHSRKWFFKNKNADELSFYTDEGQYGGDEAFRISKGGNFMVVGANIAQPSEVGSYNFRVMGSVLFEHDKFVCTNLPTTNPQVTNRVYVDKSALRITNIYSPITLHLNGNTYTDYTGTARILAGSPSNTNNWYRIKPDADLTLIAGGNGGYPAMYNFHFVLPTPTGNFQEITLHKLTPSTQYVAFAQLTNGNFHIRTPSQSTVAANTCLKITNTGYFKLICVLDGSGRRQKVH